MPEPSAVAATAYLAPCASGHPSTRARNFNLNHGTNTTPHVLRNNLSIAGGAIWGPPNLAVSNVNFVRVNITYGDR